jgi:hypothetical protein
MILISVHIFIQLNHFLTIHFLIFCNLKGVPKFINGNFLNLNLNSDCLSYDRIYVGVGVTEEQEQLIKSLIKVNGIIVMPLNDNVS